MHQPETGFKLGSEGQGLPGEVGDQAETPGGKIR